MEALIFIGIYIVLGVVTIIVFRALDMLYHNNDKEDLPMVFICGCFWPAMWICAIIFGVLWFAYKSLESLITAAARFIYEFIKK